MFEPLESGYPFGTNRRKGGLMFAFVAALLFLLAFFGVSLDGHSLVIAGLFFMALELVIPFRPFRSFPRRD